MDLDILLSEAQELNVRVDMWAFPGHTKIALLRQYEPGKGDWYPIASWKFKGHRTDIVLKRALVGLSTRVDNFLVERAIYEDWMASLKVLWAKNRAAGLPAAYDQQQFFDFRATQAHRLTPIADPKGAELGR